MLGHGLGQSVARHLPTTMAGALPALVGAAVAAVLVPLAGWMAPRILAPARPKRLPIAPSSPATVTRLRAVAPASDAGTTAALVPTATNGAADPQAPALRTSNRATAGSWFRAVSSIWNKPLTGRFPVSVFS